MRLDYLKIDEFKNLRDFQIDFDQGSQTTVLVGRNGSGKSNLLEALIIIFRDLDLGERPTFRYRIQYFCRKHEVFVDADPKRETPVYVHVDGKEIPFSRFHKDPVREYLPNYVFGYYSGPSNRMEQYFDRHQERFYEDLLLGVDRPLRPLLYARHIYSQFVLLAFFTEQDPEILEFLCQHLWIEALDSVLFVMRQPPWKSQEGDSRFWKARGTVQMLLGKLYRLALAPLRLRQRVQIGFRLNKNLEHLYLYLQDPETLRDLARGYHNQQEFFKALESIYISKLIDEVRIKVKIRSMAGSLTYRELSEGEQQLLMVLGLLRFTKEDESLFLLDEPDTHLNPLWSLQYLEFLSSIVGEQTTSHIIMTTHDPLTIAGLMRSQVQILQRDSDTGRIVAKHPEEDPRGMGIAGLLTSDVYGLRSQLDLPTLRDLDRKRDLEFKSERTESEERELRELSERLAGLDFSKTARDPLYEPFVKAMAQALEHERAELPDLTPEQQAQQQQIALQIVERLRSESETR